MIKSPIDLYDLELVHSTDRAYLIRNENGEEKWIPRSQVEYIEFGRDFRDDETGEMHREIITLTMPGWLARKINFV